MAYLTGNQFGGKLCKFLGLPPGTGRIEIVIDKNELVTIEYSGLLDLDQEKALEFIKEDLEQQKIEEDLRQEQIRREKEQERISNLSKVAFSEDHVDKLKALEELQLVLIEEIKK